MTQGKAQAFDPTDHTAFDGLMAADWIRDLESSDSRIHKEKVIEKALMASKLGSSSAQCFLYNAYLAYNPYFTYNIKQVPESDGLVDRPNPWVQFWALTEGLRTRSITGHKARDQIHALMENFDSDQWNTLCRRVLIKDLRCGISEKTLNKILKGTGWEIPSFLLSTSPRFQRSSFQAQRSQASRSQIRRSKGLGCGQRQRCEPLQSQWQSL